MGAASGYDVAVGFYCKWQTAPSALHVCSIVSGRAAICVMMFGVHRLSKRQMVLPGLIDTHVHGPQYAFTGTGYDKPLLEWLNTYTFPVEVGATALGSGRCCCLLAPRHKHARARTWSLPPSP